MRRRDFLPAIAAAPVLLAQYSGRHPRRPSRRRRFRARWLAVAAPAVADEGGPPRPLPPSDVVAAPRKGRIKRGVTGGVFGGLGTLDEQCREAARLGIKGYDLINTPDQWAIP